VRGRRRVVAHGVGRRRWRGGGNVDGVVVVMVVAMVIVAVVVDIIGVILG
jgi:hypothetical protein